MTPAGSPNFSYLAHHDARLVALATQAEEHFAGDPTVTLFKLRQFGEVLAKRAAAKVGLYVTDDNQQDLINRLADKNVIGATQRSLFHDLRRVGNAAVHEGKGDHREALHQLRMARELAVWFQRSFGNNRKFDPGPFVPPSEPKKADTTLHDELRRLRDDADARKKDLEAAERAIADARKAAEAELAERLTAEQRAQKAREDAAIWESFASEQIESHRATANEAAARSAALEEQNKKLLAELASLQAAAQALPAPALAEVVAHAATASELIDLDEAATRKLIDRQLRDAGWEVDSEELTFAKGVRPTRAKNMAIAEWPTLDDGKEGWADYVLFAGLKVVGVVEAKRKHKDIAGVIPQAKRYSKGYVSRDDLQRVGGAGDGGIDGIISLDKLGLEKVYVQAKRWKNPVGSPDIQGFMGALQLQSASKGVFITTSTFTKDARNAATRARGSIVLVDGEQLTTLMMDHGVGVTHKSLRIPKVDNDYFDEA